MSSFDTKKVIPIVHPTPNFRYESANSIRKFFVGKHEKIEKPVREQLMIGGRPVSIPPLTGPTELQILAAEEIRKEALRSYVSALQDYVPEQQMRMFLTIFLLRNLPAYTWLERASVTDWSDFWETAHEAYLQIRAMKKRKIERE